MTDGGYIWRCKYCHSLKWLPGSSAQAQDMGYKFKQLGKEEGYKHVLSRHPAVVSALQKLRRNGSG